MQTIHWLDALTPPVEDHLHKLVDTVRAFAPAQPEPERAAAPRAAATAPAAKPEQDERAEESLALQLAIQDYNIFSTGMLLLLLGVFFAALALFQISVRNDGAALASFAAGMPFLFLAHNVVVQYKKFRLAAAIVLGLLLAAIFAMLTVPPTLLPLNLDHNALLLLGIFVALSAASLFAPPQPRSDGAALYTLRVLNYVVTRRAWIFIMPFIYAVPTWIVFYQIAESGIWLIGLIIGQAASGATMIAAHRHSPRVKRSERGARPKLP
jgi:hypothetical protein